MAETYRVINQQQTTVVARGGGLADVWRVTFETVPHGYVGHVDVPAQMFNPHTVNEAITSAVDTILQVHAL